MVRTLYKCLYAFTHVAYNSVEVCNQLPVAPVDPVKPVEPVTALPGSPLGPTGPVSPVAPVQPDGPAIAVSRPHTHTNLDSLPQYASRCLDNDSFTVFMYMYSVSQKNPPLRFS